MGCQSEVTIGDNLTFTVVTSDASTGAATDADAVPSYRVYEEETGTAILNGNMAKLDDANTTGHYSEQIACTSANGFEAGKSYEIYVEAAVDSVTGATTFAFRALDNDADSNNSAIGNIAVGSGGVSVTAESFTKAGAEPETNTYTATHALDGTYHIVEDDATSTDCYYQFDVGSEGVPQSITWNGYAQSQGDSYTLYMYNWGDTDWDQVGTKAGLSGTTQVEDTYLCTTAHVGTGANLGKVRFRFLSADGTAYATDRILCTYSIVRQTAGYQNGKIWVDTNASNTNTENYVDGTADNPVSTWAAALTLSGSLGINSFNIANGSSITLTGNSDNYTMTGEGWTLVLNGQSIDGAFIHGACTVSGTGTNGSTRPTWEHCCFGVATVPASEFRSCGFGIGDGLFTGQADGEYIFEDCFSAVAGSGTPDFDFSGLGAATGINNRRWAGGAAYVLDSDCTLSHEVLAGGGTSITTGGASAEIRGIYRSLTLVLSGAGTVQAIGITGPIAISGTATTTVNLYGLYTSLADTSVNTTVNELPASADANVTKIFGSTTVDGVDIDDWYTTVLAQNVGRIVKSGDAHTYYKQDNSTSNHTLTVSATERTRS